jgi:hypothetical protein
MKVTTADRRREKLPGSTTRTKTLMFSIAERSKARLDEGGRGQVPAVATVSGPG